MSRTRNVARSLASGYLGMGANVLYALASVPLALHYLNKAEFGLWALVTQVAGYLVLIDLGLSSAVARFLIDHKDNKSDGQYGSLIKTGTLVLLVQGLCVGLGGAALSLLLPGLLDVPTNLASIFQVLVAGQCALIGLFFAGKILSYILQAHQRFDLINYTQIVQLAASFAAQWIAFHAGFGLYSFLLASLCGFLSGTVLNLLGVWRLKLFAPAGAAGKANLNIFKRVFSFGTEMFLLTLGLQLLNASQVIIVSRTQGLIAAAVWSIATKTFVLAFQFVQRIFDYSASALGEMIVRGERETLRRRYRDVLLLTASVAVFTSAAVALCNGPFLALWTKGKVSWPWYNDALMGVLLLLNLVSRCQIGLAGYAKQVRTMRWIYFLEGACFVVASFLVSRWWGMSGIILMAILANLAWSGAYGIRWAAGYLEVPARQILTDWLWPALRYLLVIVPVTAVLWRLTYGLAPWLHLTLAALGISALGLSLLWWAGLAPGLRSELKHWLRWRPALPKVS